MKQRIIMSLLFLTLVSTFCFADFNKDIPFKEGLDFYEQGNYLEAIDAYEMLVTNGIRNAGIYYNLGNAYFKNNQLGKALIYYERAFRLSPRDEDIRFNLNFVRSKVMNMPQKSLIKKIVFNIYYLFNINELTIIVSIAYLFCCILIAVYIFKKNNLLLWLIGCMAFLLVLNGFWLFSKIYNEQIINYAIVTIPQGDVHNGPSQEHSVGFTLPEGTKVSILGATDLWYAVGVKEKGLKGWITKESIEKI